LDVQAKKVEEFLSKGNKVEITLWLRGREKYNKDWAKGKMKEFVSMLDQERKIITEPQFKGRGLVIQISKK
jgi:translation initiation factor IF-3